MAVIIEASKNSLSGAPGTHHHAASSPEVDGGWKGKRHISAGGEGTPVPTQQADNTSLQPSPSALRGETQHQL